MSPSDQHSRGARAAQLARGAADWLVDGDLLDVYDPSLYHVLAGVVLALHEADRHFGDDRYAQAVADGGYALVAHVDQLDNSSLYFGLTGVAVALRTLGRHEPAERALRLVRSRFDG